MKDCEDPSIPSKLDETWKTEYDEGRFHLIDGILNHRTKNTCVMALTDRTLINTILHGCHDSAAAGHISEDRTLEKVKTCSWWPNWRTMLQNTSKTVTDVEKPTEPQERNLE
ncbi:hypothetical protein O181_098638 [Austropuccinia psidii MF-1]|uniref:Integrase zinc-binding domain-containing protein n=1 Tax=Austropuccinia psidii MF-1 TaxID=1389203 RepID=A0A9Q3J9M1_9BASI|nr:hypothetical protein [Austropuccinia psidii MF-1]